MFSLGSFWGVLPYCANIPPFQCFRGCCIPHKNDGMQSCILITCISCIIITKQLYTLNYTANNCAIVQLRNSALWLCCRASQACDCQWGGREPTQKNWVAKVDCRARPYVRKVKRDYLEQYFVFHTLYSDEYCWMSDKVFIHERHLAQSQHSRQTWISLAFKVHWGMKRLPCNKMADA